MKIGFKRNAALYNSVVSKWKRTDSKSDSTAASHDCKEKSVKQNYVSPEYYMYNLEEIERHRQELKIPRSEIIEKYTRWQKKEIKGRFVNFLY